MGKSKKTKTGWIETLYGDYWTKKKKLIIAGAVIPLIFSLLVLIELNSFLSIVLGTNYDPINNYSNAVNFVGIWIILLAFGVAVVLCVFVGFRANSVGKIFDDTLKIVHEEIYVQKKSNTYEILEKNFCLSIVRWSGKLVPVVVTFFVILLLTIPNAVFGCFSNLAIDFYSVSHISTLASYIPSIGDQLKSVSSFLFIFLPTEFQSTFQNFSILIQSLVVFVIILLFFPFFDHIEATLSYRQKGNARQIMKSGFWLTINSLNLPVKIGNFIYVTLLCLFTDQKTVSLNIPVINIDNVETAMQKALTPNKCYVARLPMNAKTIISDIKKCPVEFQHEIEAEFKKIGLGTTAFVEGMNRNKSYRKRQDLIAQTVWIIFGVNEDYVRTYAIVQKKSQNYVSRIIETLWCSDPLVKKRILEELDVLESPSKG